MILWRQMRHEESYGGEGQRAVGHQIENDWNTFDIESRDDMIRVKLNGQLVSQYAGEPGRSKTGPIGLQLHDKNSIVMFRNIHIKELKRK